MPNLHNDPMFTHRPVPTEDIMRGNWLWPTIALVSVVLGLLFAVFTYIPRGLDHRVQSATPATAMDNHIP